MTCNVCSGPIQPAAKYCGRCGTPVGAAPPPRPAADRRVVTVLFACATGVAGLEAKLGANEAGTQIDRFWSGAVRAVARFGGVVAQHSRDLVLAVFGIPMTRDDDAERAVRAADEALAEIRRLAQGNPVAAALNLRIGLATGMVVAAETRALEGAAGGGARPVSFRVAGDVVVLAQRLAEAAESGKILLDAETHRATRQSFRFQTIESRDAHGVAQTLYLFSGKRSRTGRTGALEEPLIGRGPELAALQANWQRAVAGAPTIVAVTGDAGTGKSALVRKFLVGPALEGALVRRVRCQSYQQDSAYSVAGSLLLALLGLPDDADPAVVGPALETFATDLLPDTPDAAALLGQMLGLDADEQPGGRHGLMPQQAKTAAFLAFADLLVAQSRRRTLAIVVEDLQWADDASVAWLEPLIRRLASESAAPLLVVLAGRPEGRFARTLEVGTKADPARALGAGLPVGRLDLPPLADDEALALAAYHLGSTPEALPQRVRSILAEAVARAAGNPFYLTEMVRVLESSGVLARRGATWDLEPSPVEWRLPTTVHAAVAARLDRLQAPHRRVVQAAAVMGRRFDRGLLRALVTSDTDGDDLEATLADLLEQGIFEEGTTGPGPGDMAFSQALIQEVAYGSLVEDRRRDLHRRVGLALEEKTSQSTTRFSPTLAQHFSQAGDPERSARYYAKAGDRARAAYANSEARSCYRSALEWRERAADAGSLPPQEDLLLNLALVETSLGHYDEALRLLDVRWDLAAESTRVLRARGDVLERKGDMAGALAAYRKAIVLSNNDGLESSRAMAAQANVRRRLGDFPEAIQMCRTSLSCLAGMGMPAEAAYVHGVMGICYQRMGELEAALSEHSAALRLREEAGDVEGVASSLNNLGIVSAWLGRLEDAGGYYRRSLELYRRLTDRASVGDVLNNLGDLLIKQGRHAEAESHLAEALNIARSLGHTPTTIVVLGNLADAALARGAAAEAMEHLEEAVDLVYATGHTEVMAEVRLLRGRALAVLGRTEEAAQELGEARSLAASASHVALFEEVERQARALGLEPAPRTG